MKKVLIVILTVVFHSHICIGGNIVFKNESKFIMSFNFTKEKNIIRDSFDIKPNESIVINYYDDIEKDGEEKLFYEKINFIIFIKEKIKSNKSRSIKRRLSHSNKICLNQFNLNYDSNVSIQNNGIVFQEIVPFGKDPKDYPNLKQISFNLKTSSLK